MEQVLKLIAQIQPYLAKLTEQDIQDLLAAVGTIGRIVEKATAK